MSRTRSLLKRTIVTRVRGRPSLSVFGPSRCDLSMSVNTSGAVRPMVSLMTNNTLSSVVPSPCSGSPCIRRLGRLEYCSWLTESISSSASRCSSPSILASLRVSWDVKWSTLAVSDEITASSSFGWKGAFICLATVSSLSSATILMARSSSSDALCLDFGMLATMGGYQWRWPTSSATFAFLVAGSLIKLPQTKVIIRSTHKV